MVKDGIKHKHTILQHLAIVVEVRVEAHSPMPSGIEVDQHGHLGVVNREEDIKLKTTICIRGVRWTDNKNL